METLIADLRQAFRGMRGSPGFTATAIAALALGIGANTAIFSVVNAVILKPLPYPDPDRLVSVQRGYKDGTSNSVSIPKFMFWKEHNQVFESITAAAFSGPGLNLSIAGSGSEQVQGASVSQGYFRVFGGAPLFGRTFTPAEDIPNGPAVVLLSHKLWATRLASDPKIAGKVIDLSGRPYTVLGVMPPAFDAGSKTDLWLPLQADPASTNEAHYLSVTARLKPGVTIEAANAQLKIVMTEYRRSHTNQLSADEGIKATPLREHIVGDVRAALLMLVAAVCFVLLIACANMANLLLARAATRQRELAIRAAIGASSFRLIRQMLTESVLLSLLGAAAGLALGIVGVRALLQVSPGEIPRVDQLLTQSPLAFLDWRVFAYTLGIALLTGLLFGLFPALRLSRPNLNETLKESSNRSGTGMRQNRARGMLVVSELALAIVLLTGAGLLIRTFEGLRSVPTGIDIHNILTFQTSLANERFNRSEAVDRMERQAIEQIERIPGVTAASATWTLPLESDLDLPFNIVGRAPRKGEKFDGDEYWRPVKPHIFAVYRLPLLRGRLLNENDTAASAPVVVINEVVAKKYWPKEDPLGKQVIIGKGMGPQFADNPRVIVGVVGSQRESGNSHPMAGILYLPSAQVSDAIVSFANPLLPRFWVVRTASDPARFAAPIRSVFQSVDPKLAVAKFKTLDDVLAQDTARQNFNMLLLSIFAGIALLLAAVGIYGLISYTVEQRTQEIGIRIALGARRFDTLRLVGQQMVFLLALGLAIGVTLSFLVTRYMSSLLFEVKPSDPLTFVAVALTLIVISAIATVIPARRAMRVDPVIALRYE